MDRVTEALNAILAETRFDMEYREYARFSPAGGSRRGRFREATASKLREVYRQEVEGRNVRVSVRQQAPEELMSDLLKVLRDELEGFIDPGTGRIGHAFPIEGGSAEQITVADGDLYRFEYHSELRGFARALVQAAALMGVQSATGAMAAWRQGQPVEVRMATALSGLLLSENVVPRDDIELVPLGCRPRNSPRADVPGRRAVHYLGLHLVEACAACISHGFPTSHRRG